MITKAHHSTLQTTLRVAVVAMLSMGAILLAWSRQPSAQAVVLPVASASGFPHVALYGSLNSAGQPLVDTGNGPINQTALQQFSRFPVVILPPTPLTDLRPDLMAALRTANPNQKIYAYVLGHATFCSPSYGANVYYRKYWEAVEAYDNDVDAYCNPADPTNNGGTGSGFLWWQNGSKGVSNVNLAHRVSDGHGGWRYDVAEDIATVISDTAQTGGYDGVFFDVYCDDILWQETGSLKYDYQRAGYGSDNTNPANRTAFQVGWKAGHAALAAKLRSLIAEPDFPIVGNCAQSPTQVRTTVNGWMQENFPNQNGGTWNSNMFGNNGPGSGYLSDEVTFRSPQQNFIFSGMQYQVSDPTEWSNQTQQQRARFGLASAALGNGFAAFGDYAAHAYDAPYHTWWYDEYAVDRRTGASSTNPADTGWLGQPTGDYYQAIADIASPNLITNNEFETDTSGWQLVANSPAAATLSRVQVGGDYAVQTSISALGAADYSINFGTTTTFPISNGQPIAVTFWAKAAADKNVLLVLYKPGSDYGHQTVTLTPTWKQYQVVISATANISDAKLRFDMGGDMSSVTLDSIAVQASAGASAYRRDFQYGTMLLNSNSSPVTVSLGRSYYKILGSSNPTLNDGGLVSSVSLGANDAIFLIDRDGVAPAAVIDLQATNGQVSLGGKIKVNPLGRNYGGPTFAKGVKFKSLARTWNIVAPLNRSAHGAIFVYDGKGKLRQTIKPFGRYQSQGIRAAIIVQPGTDKVFLAVTVVGSTHQVAIYRVTTSGLSLVQTVSVTPRSGSVLLSFIKISKTEYALATGLLRQQKTLVVWQYNTKRKQFIRMPKFNLKRLALTATTIKLIK